METRNRLFAGIRTLILCCLAATAWETHAATVRKPAPKSAPRVVASTPGRARIPPTARDPYNGAIVVDAETGKTMFEENSDVVSYPASVVKLMDILIIQELIEAGRLNLTNRVRVTREACGIGGSQVWLKEGESFSLEEMLYALMIKSANDVALALAIHVAGTRDGFLELMNRRAAELGMASTRFSSVHGLPPEAGRNPDITTPRDIAVLCREVLKHPDILKYTSCGVRMFGVGVRAKGVVEMRNHNRLLGVVEGVDGLKTGWIRASGYSIAATAQRNGRRVIVVVMGSVDRIKRDEIAKKLIGSAFLKLPAGAKPPLPETNRVTRISPASDELEPDEEYRSSQPSWGVAAVIVLVLGVSIALAFVLARRLGRF